MAGLLMRRVPKQELVNNIASALRDQPEFKRKGESVLAQSERVVQIACRLAAQLDSGSAMVIKTDAINDIGTPGRWGVDEPDPAGPARPARKCI